MKLERFIIDTHVHVQRHAAGADFKKMGIADPKKMTYQDISQLMHSMKAYDNSERLLYDMGCYGVDMCILHSAFGMRNEINVETSSRSRP